MDITGEAGFGGLAGGVCLCAHRLCVTTQGWALPLRGQLGYTRSRGPNLVDPRGPQVALAAWCPPKDVSLRAWELDLVWKYVLCR